MELRVIVRAEWLVVASVDARGGCPVQRFFEQLHRDAPAEHRQLSARVQEMARRGRITDEHKARLLGNGIWELKTRAGVRVLYFVDEGRVIVCTDSLRKPKPRQLSWLIKRSINVRASYLAARKAGVLRIVED